MGKALTVKDLIIYLVKHGYRYCKPKCRTWKAAFVFKHENSVLCVLLRKNGIDLRYYENYKDEVSISKDNFISMAGGQVFRNHYNESSNLINKKIAVIASCFTSGRVLDEIRIEDGRSYTLSAEYKTIRDESKKKFEEKKERRQEAKEWSDISEYVREDCGGYWGDDVWM